MSDTELLFAKKAIAKIAEMGGSHTQMALEYLKLFSCKEQPLTLAQTFDILHEIDEFWKIYPAEAWEMAVTHLLMQKNDGSLKTPLTNHDLMIDMLELIANFDAEDEEDEAVHHPKRDPPPREEQPPRESPPQMQNIKQILNRKIYG